MFSQNRNVYTNQNWTDVNYTPTDTDLANIQAGMIMWFLNNSLQFTPNPITTAETKKSAIQTLKTQIKNAPDQKTLQTLLVSLIDNIS